MLSEPVGRRDLVPGQRPPGRTRPPTRSASPCPRAWRRRPTACSRPPQTRSRPHDLDVGEERPDGQLPRHGRRGPAHLRGRRRGRSAVTIRNVYADIVADGRRQHLRPPGRDARLLRRAVRALPVRRLRRRWWSTTELGVALETQTLSVFGSDMLGYPRRRVGRRPRARPPVVRRRASRRTRGRTSGSTRASPPTPSGCWVDHAGGDVARRVGRGGARHQAHAGRRRPCRRATRAEQPLRTSRCTERGALALHALRATVGDEVFFDDPPTGGSSANDGGHGDDRRLRRPRRGGQWRPARRPVRRLALRRRVPTCPSHHSTGQQRRQRHCCRSMGQAVGSQAGGSPRRR